MGSPWDFMTPLLLWGRAREEEEGVTATARSHSAGENTAIYKSRQKPRPRPASGAIYPKVAEGAGEVRMKSHFVILSISPTNTNTASLACPASSSSSSSWMRAASEIFLVCCPPSSSGLSPTLNFQHIFPRTHQVPCVRRRLECAGLYL